MRKVPRLPKAFNKRASQKSENVKKLLHSTKWHLSQAFANFAEDAIASSSNVWQAIESFTQYDGGTKKDKIENLTKKWVKLSLGDMASFIANRVYLQYYFLTQIPFMRCWRPDWYVWNKQKVSARKWMLRTIHKKSLNYYSPRNFMARNCPLI